MATKKAPRAPRQVWLVVDVDGHLAGAFKTRKAARKDGAVWETDRVVGPFILAERKGER